MSNVERPELRALNQLEDVLSHVTDELSSWRRRALKAEGQRADLGDYDLVTARERVTEVERENIELHERLDQARRRVEGLVSRLRFIEEQVTVEEQRQ